MMGNTSSISLSSPLPRLAERPKTVDSPLYSKIDLHSLAKEIPDSVYYRETYSEVDRVLGNEYYDREVIRDKVAGTPIIMKTYVNGKNKNIIESYMSPDELAIRLRNLSPQNFADVRAVLNNQVNHASQGQIAAYEQEKKEKTRRDILFDKISEIGCEHPMGTFGPKESIAVMQHEVARTDVDASKPII
jgi:hypothetical protein